MNDEVLLCSSEDVALTSELVRFARAAAGTGPCRIVAVLMPGAPADAEDRLTCADLVLTIRGAPSTDPHVVSERLRSVVGELPPTVILLASTKRGREVAGRLAGRLDLPATTGVTGLRLTPGEIEVDRETLSGNAVAVERILRRPAIVAVLPGTVGTVAGEARPRPERRTLESPSVEPLTERREVHPKAGGQLDIGKAERIVTVGRGLRRKEDLGLIEALAHRLHAEVGCTRPLAAEAGWLTDDHWIGLTGHRVHPKLYVAVGVSGAVQHLVGMRTSRVVVAINKDPNAPILAQADYRIVGDLYQIVPALTQALGG